MKKEEITLALEFATNMFGHIKPEVKKRLLKVVEKPNQKNWEDAYTIILNSNGTMTTLWQAVIKIDPQMPRSKSCDSKWQYIPTSETIIQAIKNSTLSLDNKQLN